MQTQLEKTLTELIAIESVSANPLGCRAVISYAQRALEKLGLFIKVDLEGEHPWLLATTKATKQPKLLLAAHLDTVPPSMPEQLEAYVTDGKLHGRGAFDMKYAAACYIELLKKNQSILQQYDIGVLFTTDEEIGGHSVVTILKAGLRSDVVILPDSAVPWTIEQRAKGIVQAHVTARGSNGHASRPWENENAIHKLLPVLEQLHQTYPSLKPEGITLSISIVNGGRPRAINQVPDTASAYMDIRSFDQQELAGAKDLLKTLANEHDLELYYYVDDLPLTLNRADSYVQAFVKTMTELRGTALFADAYGGSDGRHFAAYNIPCILVSPNGNGFHQADEWVELGDLVPYCQLLEEYIFKSKLFLADTHAAKPTPVLDEMITR